MCVIGWGTVGKATAQSFNIEKYYSRSKQNITVAQAAQCRMIFVCLPTPVGEDGKYYVKDITKIVRELSKQPGFENSLVVIRSTVYPGYNRFLQSSLGIKNVVSNPEFLSEDTWEQDAKQPSIIVVGADDPKQGEKLMGLYQGRYKYNKPILTDTTTAELLKLAFNSFFVTKVIFANELYDYAQKTKANYETIKQALQGHPWGSKNHFTVHHKGGRGASGKCLRKDITAFAHMIGHSAFFDIINYRNEELLKGSNKV